MLILISYEDIETSLIEKESGFCYFCYTQGAKIKKSHSLLNIAVAEENPRNWEVDT
jgi:hypothetical protein